MARMIEIPLREYPDEVIELDLDQLPECKEIVEILSNECALLKHWITLAVSGYIS